MVAGATAMWTLKRDFNKVHGPSKRTTNEKESKRRNNLRSMNETDSDTAVLLQDTYETKEPAAEA